MAIKPLVLVFQELRAPTASIINPTLTGCVVGPHYHVRTYDEHHDELAAGTYDPATGVTLAVMPAAVPGMKLKSTDFVAYLDKARLKIDDGVGASMTEDGELTLAGEDFVLSGVKPGDEILLTKGAVVKLVKVKNIKTTTVGGVTTTDPTTVLVSSTVGFTFTAGVVTGVDFEISRKPNKSAVKATYVTVDETLGTAALTLAAKVTLGLLDRDILDYSVLLGVDDLGTVYPEYKALDVRYASIPAKISTNADVETLLGLADERNPLALGAQIMFANGQAVFHAIGLNSDDATGFLQAVDVVNRGGYYAQAVLTDDTSVIAAYKANNVAGEAPDKARYGLVIGNHKLPTTHTPAEGTGTASIDVATTLKIVWQDTAADYEGLDPVLPGDTLTVGANEYVVDTVVNSTRLKIVQTSPFGVGVTTAAYTITRALTKDQQAASVAANSVALKNKRCIMTFPNVCQLSDGTEIAGFYQNAIVAGMIIGLPSQAGITSKGVAGIAKVVNTNYDYFTEDQIDVIAAGGTLVFVQDTADSLPYIRHQLTTDPALLETGEISVVKNNDYLSLFFKGIVKPYLGEWNVTPDLLAALSIAITQGIQFQMTNKVAKIGAPLLAATIQTLEISSISPDRVEIYLDTKQPKPLNTIGLHMIL